jgi:hypothetical protein
MSNAKHNRIARCLCGSVEFEARGDPIVSLVCYCEDCQQGSRQIESLPDALAVLGSDGGTAYVVYRKDRVGCSKGAALLADSRIKEKSATRRVFARCCNSAMVMKFDDARHWVPIYRARFVGVAPPLQMRICTKFKPENIRVPDDIPSYATYAPRLLGRLLAARIAMLFTR